MFELMAVYATTQAASWVQCRSRQQTELGKIVNLMSADVNHVMQFFYPFFNQLFSAPALLIASLILLYFQIRYSNTPPIKWAAIFFCFHTPTCV